MSRCASTWTAARGSGGRRSSSSATTNTRSTAFGSGARARLDQGRLFVYLAPRARDPRSADAPRQGAGRPRQPIRRIRDRRRHRTDHRYRQRPGASASHVDGEVMTMSTPLRYRTCPGALQVVVPRTDPMGTIVHLSDIHFGRVDPRLVAPLIRTVETVAPDLVAVSGDLTQRARRSQFRQARHVSRSPAVSVARRPGESRRAALQPRARVFSTHMAAIAGTSSRNWNRCSRTSR